MKNLYFLFVLVLCFACSNSDTVLNDLDSHKRNERIGSRSMGLSVSQGSGGLSVSWNFDCESPLGILNVTNLDSGESGTYFGDSSSGSYTFSQFKHSGTYLVVANCGEGCHRVSETYYFPPKGETVVGSQTKCSHDYSKFAAYMPNELYVSSGASYVTFRFWFSDTFVMSIRPLVPDSFGGYEEGNQTFYKIHPIIWSSYSELQFPLPYHPNESVKSWEVRIYSKECFVNIDHFQFKHGSCNNYLSSKFNYDCFMHTPSYTDPLKMSFAEIKKK